MPEQNSNIDEDWRGDVSDSSGATLKIADGQVVFFTFVSEGKKKTHSDFGDSIVFQITLDDDENKEIHNWYVNPQNYSLLKQIKDLGTLKDTKVKVTRTGEKKSDTRYTLEKI